MDKAKMKEILRKGLIATGLVAAGAVSGTVWSLDFVDFPPRVDPDKFSVEQMHTEVLGVERSSNLYRMTLPFDRPVYLKQCQIFYMVDGEEKVVDFKGDGVANLWHVEARFDVPAQWNAWWRKVTLHQLKNLNVISPGGAEARVTRVKITAQSAGGGDPITFEHDL